MKHFSEEILFFQGNYQGSTDEKMSKNSEFRAFSGKIKKNLWFLSKVISYFSLNCILKAVLGISAFSSGLLRHFFSLWRLWVIVFEAASFEILETIFGALTSNIHHPMTHWLFERTNDDFIISQVYRGKLIDGHRWTTTGRIRTIVIQIIKFVNVVILI